MKTRSRDQGRTAGVGSVRRPSPGFDGGTETEAKAKAQGARSDHEMLALHKGPGAGRCQDWGQLGAFPANVPQSTDLTLF